MSLLIGPENQCMLANWRLGPDTDPGWFDTNGTAERHGNFIIATMFCLRWQLPNHTPDGIFNILHAVSLGRAARTGKTHLEQLAQILHGRLHITCRITDSTNEVQRNTVALSGSWQQYQDRTMLLIYTGSVDAQDPHKIQTHNLLYDPSNLDVLQHVTSMTKIESRIDVDFTTWKGHRVICDHEQYHRPRDHVIVHGNWLPSPVAHTPFAINRIWGSLDQTIDACDPLQVREFTGEIVPDRIGSAKAWYNCNCNNVVIQHAHRWARCTGRYQQTNSLGLRLP